MNRWKRENLEGIRTRFREKTGVDLTPHRPLRSTLRAVPVLAAVLVCCAVSALAATGLFTSLVAPAPTPKPGKIDAATVGSVEESLRFYFETVTLDRTEQETMDAEYIQACTRLLDTVEGEVVSPAVIGMAGESYLTVALPKDGVVLDPSVPEEKQEQLVGMHWSTRDGHQKLLAGQDGNALVIWGNLPSEKYGDTGCLVPLLYILTYEKVAIQQEGALAFVYGQLLTYEELAPYQVYEDSRYICCEVSGLMYSDLGEYLESMAAQDPAIPEDERVRARAESICAYYRENWDRLFYYKPFSY